NITEEILYFFFESSFISSFEVGIERYLFFQDFTPWQGKIRKLPFSFQPDTANYQNAENQHRDYKFHLAIIAKLLILRVRS
ncbi:MAG: hypothetical protein ABGW91_06055, partial [Christiangramia sp.]